MEYGEEMRAMLLAGPLTASVVGDVFLNAMRQNLRCRDPWKVALLFLLLWRSLWILLPSVAQLSPAGWARFVQVDSGVFLLVALSTGCWGAIKKGGVWRQGFEAWVATLVVDGVSMIAMAAVIVAAVFVPDKTIPGWLRAAADHFFERTSIWGSPEGRILAAFCGALLGQLVRTRLRRSSARPSSPG